VTPVFLTEAAVRDVDGMRTSQLASVRLRNIIPQQQLRRMGIPAKTLHSAKPGAATDSAVIREADVVVVGKVFSEFRPFVAACLARGTVVVIDVCDNVFAIPALAAMKDIIMPGVHVVAASQALAELVRRRTGIMAEVIGDPYEGRPAPPRFAPDQDRLRLLWYGAPGNAETLERVLPEIAAAPLGRRVALQVVSYPPSTFTPMLSAFVETRGARGRFTARLSTWSLGTMETALDACDLVIIPSDDSDVRRVKSANRLVRALVGGRFVIAHPLPEYLAMAEYARIDSSVAAGLGWALAHPDWATERIRMGQAHVLDHLTPEAAGLAWADALSRFVAARQASRRNPSPCRSQPSKPSPSTSSAPSSTGAAASSRS